VRLRHFTAPRTEQTTKVYNRQAKMNTPQSVRDRTLRLLILGDIAVEDVALQQQLDRAGIPAITRRVDGAPAFREALLAFAPDIVLSAPSLEAFDAPAAVALLRAARPIVPL